jgi:hypothetical protein
MWLPMAWYADPHWTGHASTIDDPPAVLPLARLERTLCFCFGRITTTTPPSNNLQLCLEPVFEVHDHYTHLVPHNHVPSQACWQVL